MFMAHAKRGKVNKNEGNVRAETESQSTQLSTRTRKHLKNNSESDIQASIDGMSSRCNVYLLDSHSEERL